MSPQTYLDLLESRYAPLYDVQRHATLNGRTVDILATSIRRVEKYILTKDLPVYGYDTCTIGIVKSFPGRVDAARTADFLAYVRDLVPHLVTPSADRLSTTLNGVIVCEDGADPAAASYVSSFRWSKAFALGLKGWVEIGAILVDLVQGTVHTNAAARAFRESHRPSQPENPRGEVMPVRR